LVGIVQVIYTAKNHRALLAIGGAQVNHLKNQLIGLSDRQSDIAALLSSNLYKYKPIKQ